MWVVSLADEIMMQQSKDTGFVQRAQAFNFVPSSAAVEVRVG